MAAPKMYGLLAVKLTEIPLEQRIRAARRAVKESCHSDEETCSVLVAAMFPSDKIYFVRAQAAGELPVAA